MADIIMPRDKNCLLESFSPKKKIPATATTKIQPTLKVGNTIIASICESARRTRLEEKSLARP